MKLSEVEFRALNTLWRKWGQTYFELPLFRHLGLDPSNKDILEIGCGNGYSGYLLNQLGPKSYIGLDVTEEQIAIARRKYPRYVFLNQDATDLTQFTDASKDVVILFGVLHHIPKWRRTIDEIARVLKPSGQLFLEEPRGLDVTFFDFFFRQDHIDTFPNRPSDHPSLASFRSHISLSHKTKSYARYYGCSGYVSKGEGFAISFQ